MKMNQLFTAYYMDRTAVYEKSLDYIYSHNPDNLREIRPTIWLWKGDISPVFRGLCGRRRGLYSCYI